MDYVVEIGSPLFWLGIGTAVVCGIVCGLLYIYRMLGKRIKND